MSQGAYTAAMHIARWWVMGLIVWGVRAAESAEPHPWLQEADAHVARLLEVRSQLQEEVEQARSRHETNRVDCLRRSEVAVQSLVELSESARRQLVFFLEEGAEADAQEQRDWIQAAVTRAEQHLRQALLCEAEPPVGPRRRTTVREGGPPLPAKTPSKVSPWRRLLIAGRIPCLRQGELACMIGRAISGDGVGEDCVSGLQQRGVEPLQGWQPDQCATANDVCVVLVRVLGLPVADTRQAHAYRAALREYGVAVEGKLPAGDAPVSAPEVRQLLMMGFGR